MVRWKEVSNISVTLNKNYTLLKYVVVEGPDEMCF